MNTSKTKDDSSKGYILPLIIFIVLAISMAPIGIFYWIDKAGISIPFPKSDGVFITSILAFLFLILLSLLFSAKSKKMFRVVTWILLGLAITNISGCMAMWQGFNGAFG